MLPSPSSLVSTFVILADMEVDKVADKVANMATDKNKPRAILP